MQPHDYQWSVLRARAVVRWGGHMGVGLENNIVMKRARKDLSGQVPVSLADEIGWAPRSDVPVLITGGPTQSREIAFAIDRRSHATNGSVDVIDCRSLGALARV